MANHSLISVPPNVADPVVLQRFLARLVEQVDIVLGNRAGPATQYIDQQTLINTANDLILQLTEAKEELEKTIVEASTKVNINIQDLLELINDKEPKFNKNTAFNKDFGTIANTVAEGNHIHGETTLSSIYGVVTTIEQV